MDDKGEIARRKLECPNITLYHLYSLVRSQVRRFGHIGPRVAAEDNGLCIKFQLIVGKDETLQQPAAEEARSACDEDLLAFNLFPEPCSVLQYVLQVYLINALCHALSIDLRKYHHRGFTHVM